ncbi:hypothetical protein [Variovorax sp. W2I14]|uniref:hypothetical protein n=1 Tax=Variovorax sp. W2I14 TaxID=3042290 RepID=UPI003D1D4B98
MDAQALIGALSTVLDNMTKNPRIDFPKDTTLAKAVGGVSAVLEFAGYVTDLRTMVEIQNETSRAASTLKPKEVGYFSVSVAPGGVVSVARVASKDAPVLIQAGVKQVTVPIVGVQPMPSLVKRTPEEDARERKEIQDRLDAQLREAIQNSQRK